MADDLREKSEDVTQTLTPEPVYGLPERVVADWPTEEDLGVEDDQPVESTRHREQADLLCNLLRHIFGDRPDILIAADLAVYFRPEEPPVVPDVMVVFGVEPKEDRPSYTVWEEKKGPAVVVELLSKSNPYKDRERNYEIYEQRLLVPEYFWFDPLNPSDLHGFRLRGDRYEELALDAQGRLWSEELGVYFSVAEGWLRLYDREGNLILTGDEQAAHAQAEAQQERAARAAAEAKTQQERAARAAAEELARTSQQRAEAAEAEVIRLREEIAQLKADEIRNTPA